MINFDEDKQNQRVRDLLKREEENVVQLLAQKLGVQYVDLSVVPVETDALKLIDEKTSREAKIVAFKIVDKNLHLAVRNPEDPKSIEVIEALKAKRFIPVIYTSSTASLEKGWNAYKDLSFAIETKAGSLEISSDEISAIIEQTKDLNTVISILQNTLSAKKSYRVSRILETIIAGALATKASDVHIEPEETYIRLRYRLDGVLTDVIKFDHDTFSLLLSRIKLLSGLKLNIKKDAQDGRFSVRLSGTDIEIRTSILPGAYSESIVLRVLNPSSIGVPLEELGIPKKLLSKILEEVEKPNGMLLTTGPTGSGKTTTLYAFLKKVHGPGVKIITIEDPIEYHLPGIVQTQVNDKGYTFLEGLRSSLRQDPDIIMVGEIRDGETATIAINSALTGHLVFSTLHTNSAAGAFPRLIDLGINPKIMNSAINIALAQRLVRRLCPDCKKEEPLTGGKLEKVKTILDSIVDKDEIKNANFSEGTFSNEGVPTKTWVSSGCEKCNNTGYKGRVGLYEGILMTKEVSNVIEMSPSEDEVWKASASQGILTMSQDGIIKSLQGVTSIEELERVIELKALPR